MSWNRTVCVLTFPVDIHLHRPQIKINFLINHFKCKTPVNGTKIVGLIPRKTYSISFTNILCLGSKLSFIHEREQTL
jgi:hypothetical protein